MIDTKKKTWSVFYFFFLFSAGVDVYPFSGRRRSIWQFPGIIRLKRPGERLLMVTNDIAVRGTLRYMMHRLSRSRSHLDWSRSRANRLLFQWEMCRSVCRSILHSRNPFRFFSRPDFKVPHTQGIVYSEDNIPARISTQYPGRLFKFLFNQSPERTDGRKSQ